MMLGRRLQLGIVACLIAGSSWAAGDPFLGKWKVDPARSRLYDEVKVEMAGPNRFVMTFGPGQVDTVTADGTDQPALAGTTLSVTRTGPGSLEVVRKLNGRMLLRARWTLSADGRSLKDDFIQYLPDGLTLFSTPMPNGSYLFMPYVYERTAGTSGFAGTWDSASATVKKGMVLQIAPDEAGGLTLKRSDEPQARRIALDGQDHPDPDRGVPDAAHLGRRVNERSVEVTDKLKGEITGVRRLELSADLATLTMTERLAGQLKPKSILVFDRESGT